MKKVAVALVVIVAGWFVVTLTIEGSRREASLREWPMGLGTLESVPKRYPGLLTSDRPPDYRAVMREHRKLPTRDWPDLRAHWQLARPLWQRPEIVSTLVALKITTDLSERAAELPRPAPPWFEKEVRTYDYRKAMLASMQFETWLLARMMRDYAAGDPGADMPRRLRDQATAPYLHLARVDLVAHRQATAVALANGEPLPEIAWWNRPAMMTAPNVEEAWKKVVELEGKLK